MQGNELENYMHKGPDFISQEAMLNGKVFVKNGERMIPEIYARFP